MKPSATVAINELSDELRRKGRRIYKLGLGQSPFPVPETVVDELRRHAGEKDYLPTPAWVSYVPQARIIGRQVRQLPTLAADNWRLTARQLDEHCRDDPSRPRLLILNYPSNPTAATYTPAELEELAGVARRYRIILLSDEIYAKLHHGGEHASIVPFYPRGTIFSGGLSKWCGAGGWRLGAFVFPESLRWLLDAMAAVASETYTSTSALIQYAAVRAFEGGDEIERYLEDSRRILKTLGRKLALDLLDAGAEIGMPEGGFYLFPDLSALKARLAGRGIRASHVLCEKVLPDAQRGVFRPPFVKGGRGDSAKRSSPQPLRGISSAG